MKSDDRFTTVSVIAVAVATVTLFAIMNVGVPTTPEVEVVYEPVPAVEPLRQPTVTTGPDRGPDASLAVLRGEAAIPVPAVDSPTELPRLITVAQGVLAARAPEPGLPSTDTVLVREDGDGRLVVAAGTMRGYRPLVEELVAFDPAGLAAAAENDREGLLLAAIDRLLAVEVPEVEPTMTRRGVRWGFVDASYESLDEAQRQLLLMGRSQHRRVRAKLLELRAALGVFPAPVDATFDTASLDVSEPGAEAGTAPREESGSTAVTANAQP